MYVNPLSNMTLASPREKVMRSNKMIRENALIFHQILSLNEFFKEMYADESG